MIYKFLALADIHWGAMDSQYTYENLRMVLKFIRRMKNEIDFLVICGDYFDYRIQLNSKTALYAIQWMDELVKTCKECGVKKIRILKGTQEHDNDQLEIFRPNYEDDSGYFRISEQLFDDLRVVYCPDETINSREYHELHWREFVPNPDIGFFHGNFDYQLPEIEYKRIMDNHLPTIIYEYGRMSRLIKGPLISGHWHVPTEKGAAYYVGSYDRWMFGEEEPKGFLLGAYDTQTHNYLIERIENIQARVFKTRIVTSEEVSTPKEFSELASQIRDQLREDADMKLRILYLLSSEDIDILTTFNEFQRQFANNSQVRIVIKDLVKRAERKKKKEEVQLSSDKYDYVFNSDPKAIPDIIRQYIRDKRNIDIPSDVIVKYVGKYLEDLQLS